MDDVAENQSPFSKISGELIELIEFVAVVAAVIIIIRSFVALPHRVEGHSMEPNFHDGDMIITYMLSTRFSDPVRGEVIILKNPRNENEDFIKRVIGMPGETLRISQGKVYINNQLLNEPYLPNGTITRGGSVIQEDVDLIVPIDSIVAMGDNRGGSLDSRELGPIKKTGIIGQAFLRYWPINKTTLIKIETPSI